MGVGEVHLGLGQLAMKAGDGAPGVAHLERAREAFGRAGNRVGVARVLNLLGDIARFAGRTHEAADYYRAAHGLLEALGSWMAIVPEVNLGLLLLEEGRWAAARSALQPLLAELATHQATEVEACALAGILVAASKLGDAGLVAEIRARLDGLLPQLQTRDPELVALLARAEAAG